MADKKDFSIGDYVEVNQRVITFYERYPDGRIVSTPPQVVQLGDKTFIQVRALVYRTPDDSTPCEASAWEVFPGQTPYTKNSEMMNAETSAWGRALAAAGIETKKSMASADEVRNRQAEREAPPVDDRPWYEKAGFVAAVEREGLTERAVCERASRGARRTIDSFEQSESHIVRAAFKALLDERAKVVDGGVPSGDDSPREEGQQPVSPPAGSDSPSNGKGH